MAFIRFSTQDYPLAERLEAAQDIYAAIANIEIATQKGNTPTIETRLRLLPGVSIAMVESSPLIVNRRSRQLQDGNDDFSLLINPTGRASWISELHGVGEIECAPGAGCFGFNDRPGTVVFHGNKTYMLNISFSRALLAPLVVDLERKSKSPFLSSETFVHLVQCAIELVQDQGAEEGDILGDTNRLLDLAALSVGAPRDVEIVARQRGLKQARLRAVKADLMINAWRSNISLDWVAKRHGVSPGYIRAMFEQEGQSFTDYVLELRLDRVFQALSSPVHAHKSVSAILYDAGFNNPSWFYRAFKRRFGMTPSEARDPAANTLS